MTMWYMKRQFVPVDHTPSRDTDLFPLASKIERESNDELMRLLMDGWEPYSSFPVYDGSQVRGHYHYLRKQS